MTTRVPLTLACGDYEIVRALNAAGCETSYVNIESDKGHDAFFVEEPEFEAGLRGFIDAAANARGLPKRVAQ